MSRVSRPWTDFEEGGAEWRLDAKKGLVLEARAKHCRTFDEWDETFTALICKAPEDARDLLFQFRRWMKLMSVDYSWDHLRKFYDYLCARMEREASTTFELVSYTAHWEMYKRDKGVKAKGAGGGGSSIGSNSWGGSGGKYPRKVQDQRADAEPKEGAQRDRSGGGKGRDAIKSGVCFSFNSAAGCGRRNCKFAHKCQKCGDKGHVHYDGHECTAPAGARE